MKNGPLKGGGSPTEEKESSLFGKKKKRKEKKRKQEQRNIIMGINCEVLLQEFNKYLFFFCNNAMDQLVTV